MEINLIPSGLSNKLFLIECNGVKKILRIFGTDMDGLIDHSLETKILNHLGQHNLAPKIDKTFNCGRVEQFIENSTVLSIENLDNKIILKNLIEKIIGLHNLDINFIPKTDVLAERLKLWTNLASQIDNEHQEIFTKLPKLLSKLETINSQIKFCHNDLTLGNILLNEKSITLIDFEYAGYNFFEYDIANMLCEIGYSLEHEELIFLHILPKKYSKKLIFFMKI
ncbi:Choline/ethanolamine kinase [uncultured virus]|nr:Choline/ethanolamine kinase [uncultured virus]